MKREYWPLLSVFLLLSGCGQVDWFPAPNPSTTPSNSNLTAPTLSAALSPTSIASGGNSTLTLTIANKSGNPAQTGLAFSEALPTGVTATVANGSQCGGNLAAVGSSLVFISGALASGAANCTLTATLKAINSGTTAQSIVIKSADFSLLQGGLVSGVTDQTLTVAAPVIPAPTLTVAVKPTAMLDGGSSALNFTITNQTGNPAQSGLAFTEAIPTNFKANVTTASQCGGTLAVSGTNLTFSGGQLASGAATCTLSADLSLGAALLNTITTDQSFSVKATDFGGLQGTLVSGVTDQTFKVFPSALTSTGTVVTISNLVAVGTSNSAGAFDFAFTADTSNASGAPVSATVKVVGIDASGAQIAATLDTLTVTIPTNAGGVKTSGVALSATPFSVSSADSANVAFWRLLSVTVP